MPLGLSAVTSQLESWILEIADVSQDYSAVWMDYCTFLLSQDDLREKKAVCWNYYRQWRTAKVWCMRWRRNIIEDKFLNLGIDGVVF